MSMYENLVMQTQMNYSRYYGMYMAGKTPYKISDRVISYEDKIDIFAEQIQKAECIIVGGASGLSASGGGDFYYEDNESYRKYFKPFADKYHFKGAFQGMQYNFDTINERWGYLATFLHTTQTAPVRKPYIDLDAMLKGKDFHILTTNQDTQFVKLYPEEKVSEIQGDHRFFQCSRQCRDYVWDAVEPVNEMYEAMAGGRFVPDELIPHPSLPVIRKLAEVEKNGMIPGEAIPKCPLCGAPMDLYSAQPPKREVQMEWEKFCKDFHNKKIVILELGIGWRNQLIKAPLMRMTAKEPQATYVTINLGEVYITEDIKDKSYGLDGYLSEHLSEISYYLIH